jgi:hypothetical protein
MRPRYYKTFHHEGLPARGGDMKFMKGLSAGGVINTSSLFYR